MFSITVLVLEFSFRIIPAYPAPCIRASSSGEEAW
jgi:hypothetical protein